MDKLIGERIRILRKGAGYSQDDLAKMCGYKHKSSINKIELGLTDLPTEKVKVIADALGVSTVYLTTGINPPEQRAPMKGWTDELVRMATALNKARRNELMDFAAFLTACQEREKNEAYLSAPQEDDGFFTISVPVTADEKEAEISPP